MKYMKPICLYRGFFTFSKCFILKSFLSGFTLLYVNENIKELCDASSFLHWWSKMVTLIETLKYDGYKVKKIHG